MSVNGHRAAACCSGALAIVFLAGAAPPAGESALRASTSNRPSLLAFQSRQGGDYEIYLAAPDTGAIRQLTRNNLNDRLPDWSPDGKRLLFIRSNPQGIGSYYVMTADGRRAWRLGRAESPYEWSPDGRMIAFTERGRPGLSVVNADGSGRKSIYAQVPVGFEWSPDGRELAFGCGSDICATRVAGGQTSRLIQNGVDPDWSPDGRRIAFVRDRSVYIARSDGTGAKVVPSGGYRSWSPDSRRLAIAPLNGLAIVNSNGRGFRWIYRGDSFDVLSVLWSPDARHIAFDCGGDSTDICVANVASAAVRNVTATEDRREIWGQWSPDSSTIAFNAYNPKVDGDEGIFVVQANGGAPFRVTELYGEPTWAPDGRWISFWPPTATPDLYVVHPDGSKLTRIARLALREAWQPSRGR
jgi:Tol biopolymer transport system component